MYKIALFLHIIGVMVMFAAVGVTITGMLGMFFAKENKALGILSFLTVKMDHFLPFSAILILIPGLYMVITAWGWKTAWINVSLVVLILMTILGPTINLPRLKDILNTVNQETGNIPSIALHKKIRNRVLWNSVSIMAMEIFGIIYMMTVKPGIEGSLLALFITAILGWAFSNLILKK